MRKFIAGSTPARGYALSKKGNNMDNTDTIKCMCGHTIPEKDVTYVNPATKAVTWTEGLPYCGSCVPEIKED